MLKNFIELAELAVSLGGHVSFEWPGHCTGWLLATMTNFIYRNSLFMSDVDASPLGMTDADGTPILEQWRFVTSCERHAVSLSALRGMHPKDFIHGAVRQREWNHTQWGYAELC